MLFNSLAFAGFLPVVFFLYWMIRNRGLATQNALLLISSYVFYGWWDWRFLSLIAISTLTDYVSALRIGAAPAIATRRRWLYLSLAVNLGMLGGFKYFGFFLDSWVGAWAALGVEMRSASLAIILPVGISFYTFQTLSYTIDVYRGRLEPTRDIVAFAAFVSFFPQLVAGPIERATNLLPQFFSQREFDYQRAVDGMRQVLWGFYKKVVIADNCAVYVNRIFADYQSLSGTELALGAVYFAFQIYGDFSGYSDIAIGTAKLFGFDLRTNFRYPYFSRDIAEFWRRWHISLSTWFRDYLYIPLGGSRGGVSTQIRNIFVIFAVSGFWHGANWTFIVWGVLNALFFLPLLLRRRNRLHTDTIAQGRTFPGLRESLQVLGTFGLTCVAWVFFRADSVSHALGYLGRIVSSLANEAQHVTGDLQLLFSLVALLAVEWIGREKDHPLTIMSHVRSRSLRWLFYYAILASIIVWRGGQQPFIYFQF